MRGPVRGFGLQTGGPVPERGAYAAERRVENVAKTKTVGCCCNGRPRERRSLFLSAHL